MNVSESRLSVSLDPASLAPRGREFDRLVATAIGGAFLGASLAGWPGLAVGALVGVVSAQAVNRTERERARPR